MSKYLIFWSNDFVRDSIHFPVHLRPYYPSKARKKHAIARFRL